MDRGTYFSVVNLGREEMANMPAVTAVLFHHNCMGTGTDFGIIGTG